MTAINWIQEGIASAHYWDNDFWMEYEVDNFKINQIETKISFNIKDIKVFQIVFKLNGKCCTKTIWGHLFNPYNSVILPTTYERPQSKYTQRQYRYPHFLIYRYILNSLFIQIPFQVFILCFKQILLQKNYSLKIVYNFSGSKLNNWVHKWIFTLSIHIKTRQTW